MKAIFGYVVITITLLLMLAICIFTAKKMREYKKREEEARKQDELDQADVELKALDIK